MPKPFQIAIASDLHCHSESTVTPAASFLLAGKRRLPAERHPTESLLKLIEAKELCADILVCPGDLAHQVCEHGMMQAFTDLKEIRRVLGSEKLLCCLGNHDVNSRGENGESDPFRLARELASDFPIDDPELRDKLQSSGFCVTNVSNQASILILNTVIDHNDKSSAIRGTFNDNRLSELKSYLAGIDSTLNPIRVVVMHHHPILHSFADYESSDVLANGDAILQVVSEFGFRLVIHGHRHEPRIARLAQSSTKMCVFASGSFSAMLNVLGSVTRNMFHIIKINGDATDIEGEIKSWEFNYGSGWVKTSVKSGNFMPTQAFSTSPPEITCDMIATHLNNMAAESLSSRNLEISLPGIKYLDYKGLKQLSGELTKSHQVQISFNEHGELSSIGKIYQGS